MKTDKTNWKTLGPLLSVFWGIANCWVCNVCSVFLNTHFLPHLNCNAYSGENLNGARYDGWGIGGFSGFPGVGGAGVRYLGIPVGVLSAGAVTAGASKKRVRRCLGGTSASMSLILCIDLDAWKWFNLVEVALDSFFLVFYLVVEISDAGCDGARKPFVRVRVAGKEVDILSRKLSSKCRQVLSGWDVANRKDHRMLS